MSVKTGRPSVFLSSMKPYSQCVSSTSTSTKMAIYCTGLPPTTAKEDTSSSTNGRMKPAVGF